MSDLNQAPDSAGRSAEEHQEGWDAAQADQFVDELVLGLERAADGESDPEIKSRLRGAAMILATVGRHVTTEVAAKIISHAMDF
ncbi:hypothetical protein KGA66_06315 [Actinocrinis puniceicyclus]|uniref:Uncharacterized protein n=1 Tax=Actinocrinis puniceicyclus TaxID=977794 RepID=A0A8J7WI78_9ACTN|nr:hypothetical protein [Actinocrinis puniceicyclus]MBS2962651.1 hypothetical protein [Actinocrinis puniceicyclus]